jgi:uncharacterized membrane protein YkvA (DUF1232 family)
MDKELERRFLEAVSRHLVSLPFDLKVLYEALSDPDLEREAREVAAAAVVYVLSPSDIVVDRDRKLASYVDDLILLRAALKRVAETGGEKAQAFVERFPDEYADLDDYNALYAQALGDLYPWLVGKLDVFKKLLYKGRKAVDYIDDDEAATFLYGEWLTFQTDYDITEQTLSGRLRKGEPILEAMRRRRAEEAKKIS